MLAPTTLSPCSSSLSQSSQQGPQHSFTFLCTAVTFPHKMLCCLYSVSTTTPTVPFFFRPFPWFGPPSQHVHEFQCIGSQLELQSRIRGAVDIIQIRLEGEWGGIQG